jgi:hypothetical protein
MVSLEFFIDIILLATLLPWVDSASNRSKYEEYFLGGKGGWCIGLTILPPSCADYIKILGASTYWNAMGLSSPVMGLLYFHLLPLLKRQSRMSEEKEFCHRCISTQLTHSQEHFFCTFFTWSCWLNKMITSTYVCIPKRHKTFF